MKKQVYIVLDELKHAIEKAFGFSEEMNEPRINLGPCAPFAKAFFDAWNCRFSKKVHICFIMDKTTNECWHTLVRLPEGSLYDGGLGVHNDSAWDKSRFFIDDMNVFDQNLLEERSYGMDRAYPKHCPNFDKTVMINIIKTYLGKIESLDIEY